MNREQKSISPDISDKPGSGKLFRDWISLMLSIVGASLGMLGFINSLRNTTLTHRIEATALLDEAWDLLGGKEGSDEVRADGFVTSPYELEKANRKIQRAKQLAPDFAKVYWTESSLAFAKGQFEKSIALGQKAIELDPSASTPHTKIGLVFLNQEKFDQAEAEFKAASMLDKNDPAPLSNLCFVYFKLGKLNEAAETCEQAIKADPTWQMTYENFAAIRAAQGRMGEARELLSHINDSREKPPRRPQSQ